MKEPPLPTQLVEIEGMLRNDPSGQYRRKLLDQLSAHGAKISHLTRHGDWTPSEFRALELLQKAIQKASSILKSVKP
jgi:hypothetical protein